MIRAIMLAGGIVGFIWILVLLMRHLFSKEGNLFDRMNGIPDNLGRKLEIRIEILHGEPVRFGRCSSFKEAIEWLKREEKV
jgi:hypothetical protein